MSVLSHESVSVNRNANRKYGFSELAKQNATNKQSETVFQTFFIMNYLSSLNSKTASTIPHGVPSVTTAAFTAE